MVSLFLPLLMWPFLPLLVWLFLLLLMLFFYLLEDNQFCRYKSRTDHPLLFCRYKSRMDHPLTNKTGNIKGLPLLDLHREGSFLGYSPE